MSQPKTNKKHRFNALDFSIVLLVFLVCMGIAGRIILDRRNSDGMETRTVSFTCTLEENDAEFIAPESVLKDERKNTVAEIVSVLETTEFVQTEGNTVKTYHRITGNMTVRGYEGKDGVFYSKNGTALRINTSISLYGEAKIQFYINDIVKNGQ